MTRMIRVSLAVITVCTAASVGIAAEPVLNPDATTCGQPGQSVQAWAISNQGESCTSCCGPFHVECCGLECQFQAELR